MANVLNAAQYVLSKSGCINMTKWKLQKLVYYCQAWSLAWDNTSLFYEDFEAWFNGPVCRKLHNQLNGIFHINKHYLDSFKYDGFTSDEIETMDEVLAYYGDKKPYELREIVREERPWIEARDDVSDSDPCDNIITKESICEYYGGL